MADTLIQRSFAAGEIAPALTARADTTKYLTALKTCRNFLVLRSGGVGNRPGTKYCATTKNGTLHSKLLPFCFPAANQSYVIEAGNGYFRFFQNGAPVVVSGVAAWSGVTAYVVGDLVVSGGVNYYCILAHTNHVPPNATYWYALTGTIYEIPTPYPGTAFETPAPAQVVQQGDVLTITHLDHAPMELRRYGATRWVLAAITTGPSISAPGSPSGSSGGAGTNVLRYVITAVKAETYEESVPSSVVTLSSCALPTVAAPHSLSWSAVTGAVEYYIYIDPFGNGTYGYVGTATGQTSFKDTGLAPDYSNTPPIARTLFASTNNYPATAAYYQQRRIFGGTHTNREQVFASQTGFYSNFCIRSPLQEDDAVTFTIASDYIQPVHHLIALKRLVLLSDAGEWIINGDSDGVLTPMAINADQHGWAGSNYARPAVVNNSIVFVQARGNLVRDLRFDQEVEGYSGRDLSVFATHLFEGFEITELAYQQTPNSIVWAVRDDGTLLALTYLRDQDIWGWSRHDTANGGDFEDVCCIPESGEDAVYMIVRRTINGSETRFVERLAARPTAQDPAADAFFVDAGLTYNGAPATVISGLSYLEGQTVAVLGDGTYRGTYTVASGAITLAAAASIAHVGLPITAEIETLDLDVQGSSIRDQRKRVQSMALLIENSARGFYVGPDSSHLLQDRKEGWMPTGLVTGQTEINLTAGFTNHGRTVIRQTEPLPLTILGVLPHVETEGTR
jgi:hypothetical protein